MNKLHLEFLASPMWAEMLRNDLLPWLRDTVNLGDVVLEVGPGPGLTTDLLRKLTSAVVAVEADEDLARALAARMAGTNVKVLHADATQAGLQSDRFSAVTCFSMLHHMPSPGLQDRLFAEAFRMLGPGGTFVGTDSLDMEPIRQFHVDDLFVPADPETLDGRLRGAGFSSIEVTTSEWELRFQATKRV